MSDNVSSLGRSAPYEPSLGELVGQMSEQTSRLIRDEMRLAQAEMTAKGKFVIAAVASLIARREVSRAVPPVPAEAVAGLRQDAQTLKPGGRS